MRSFLLFTAIAIFTTIPVKAAETFRACDKIVGTQSEVNRCAADQARAADRELNEVYQAVMREFRRDVRFVERMRASQRAWIRWRDAEMEAIYPERRTPGYYGSSFSGCWSLQIAALTRERTRQLRKWIDGLKEGDLCAGSIPVR